jgi:glucose/arabinose dehydrogenase
MTILDNLPTESSTDLNNNSWLLDDLSLSNSSNSNDTSNSASNLVFINYDVENYQALTKAIAPEFTVFVLNSQNGVAQISEVLNNYTQVDSIHLITHGESGSISLGNTVLDGNNLSLYENELSTWSEKLSDGGDILLYGCNVAAGEGIGFVNTLSNITGADLAASVDLTGSIDMGGDGDLEYTTGTIEAELAIAEDAIANWDFLLDEDHNHNEDNEYVVQTDPNFQNQLLLSGLSNPVSAEFLPDGRMLILEKGGTVKITDPKTNVPTTSTYLTLPNILTNGEKGLIDIALDPNFATNNHFYLYYTLGTDKKFQISRFTHQGNTASLSSELVIWKDPNPASSPDHFGGGLDFGPDGKLYLTTGDKGLNTPQLAQNLNRIEGKILRINKDGSIPSDNPFVDGPGGKADEIWAYGLRNPFRANWDFPSGNLYIGDVGFDSVEEVNRINVNNSSGVNFGWPLYEGSAPNGVTGVVNPVYEYPHTSDQFGSGAVMGGFVYRGTQFPSQFQGAYFFGDYTQDYIQYLKFDASGNVIDADTSTSTIDAFNFEQKTNNSNPEVNELVFLDQGIDGALYFLTLTGQLRRIVYNDPSGGNQAPVINEQTTTATQTTGSTYEFNGVATDPNGDTLSYTWNFGDGTQATGANVTHTYTGNGQFTPTLVVSDGQFNDSYQLAPIQLGTAPTAMINLVNGSTTLVPVIEPDPITGEDRLVVNNAFKAGDTISFTGIGNDPDGTLTNSSYSWDIKYVHDDHFHPELTDFIGSSSTYEISTTEHGFTADLQIGFQFLLTVTDSDGLSTETNVTILPKKVDLTFNDNLPGNFQFTLDGINRTSQDTNPFVVDTAVNFQHNVVAPATRTVNSVNYVFDGWSTGQTSNTLSLAAPTTNQTYVANYVVDDNPNPNPEPPVTNGLVLRLDADNGVTTSGNLVTGWNDLSASGNNLTGTGNPQLITGGLNGRNTIAFDGDGDSLQRLSNITGLPTSNSDRTVFVVANYDSVGNGGFTYGQASRGKAFGLVVNGGGKLGVQGWGSAADRITNTAGTNQGWLVQSVKLQAGTLTQYKDGTLIDTDPAAFNTNLTKLLIGSEIDGSPFLNMDMASVLVYNRALSEAEQQQIENYLQQKYFSSNSANNPPNAVADTAEVDINSTNNPLDVLSNDTDLDEDTLIISGVSTPNNGGTVTINGNSDGLLYTPAANFSGEETFSYTVSDGNGGTDTAIATITVSNINNTPVVVGDSYSIAADSSNNFLNVLANDSDPDGDPLTIIDLTTPDSGGTVSISPNGTGLIYTPAAGFVGTETFTYNVEDPSGASPFSEAAVSITVNPNSALPVSNGLVLNLDANNGVTTNGSLVTGWNDLSSSGNNLVSTGNPQLVNGALNGNNIIDFDGDGDALQRLSNITGLPTGNGDRTVFMVANYNSVGNGGFTYGQTSRGKAFGLIVNGGGKLGVQGWGGTSDRITDTVGTNQGWLVQSVKLQAGTLTQYKNGTLIDTDPGNFSTALNKIVIGSEIDGSPNLDMSVASVIVFNRALSETERQQVENYLQQKYFD